MEAGAKTRMEKAVTDLQHEMASIRTGRASVSIFDSLKVDYYGTPTPINQVANLHVPEPSLITIQPWDVSQIGAIEKAIRTSDLGLNPGNDGKIIRVPIPALTEERRKEIVKRLHHVAEDHRVALRNIRRDANEHLKKLLKDKAISEDDERKALDDVQKMTDGYIARWTRRRRPRRKRFSRSSEPARGCDAFVGGCAPRAGPGSRPLGRQGSVERAGESATASERNARRDSTRSWAFSLGSEPLVRVEAHIRRPSAVCRFPGRAGVRVSGRVLGARAITRCCWKKD